MILLHVESIEPGSHEVIFEGHFQVPNVDQYRGMTSPSQGGLGHYWYLTKPVYPLNRDQWAAYVAPTVQRILKFLEI